MSFLDALLLGIRNIQSAGVTQPERAYLNFLSGTVADNPSNNSIDYTPPAAPASAGPQVVHTSVDSDYSVTETTGFVLVIFSGFTANRTLNFPGSPTAGMQIAYKDSDGSLAAFSLTVNSEAIFGAKSAQTYEYDGSAWHRIAQSMQRVAPSDSATGLWWKFDETSSPWANSGTEGALNMATGVSAAVSRTGLFGNCLDFSSAAIKTATTSVGEYTNNLSVSVWVMLRSDSGVGHILNKNYNTSTWASPFSAWQIYMQGLSSGQWGVGLTANGAQTLLTLNSPWGIPKNVWSLLSLTYAESTGELRAYLNGTLAGSTVIAGTHPVDYGNHGYYQVGGLNPTSAQFFDGLVDGLRVEHTIRTAQYYQTLYKQGLRLSDP